MASTANQVGRTVHGLADKANDKVQDGISRATGRVQSGAQQSFDALSDVAGKARDMAGRASDGIVSYTKQNPAMALAIAAAAGGLLYAAIRSLRAYRA
jgi:ElaB/YqjD/DUF883 family membrane-anchored ribosome-binding protein